MLRGGTTYPSALCGAAPCACTVCCRASIHWPGTPDGRCPRVCVQWGVHAVVLLHAITTLSPASGVPPISVPRRRSDEARGNLAFYMPPLAYRHAAPLPRTPLPSFPFSHMPSSSCSSPMLSLPPQTAPSALVALSAPALCRTAPAPLAAGPAHAQGPAQWRGMHNRVCQHAQQGMSTCTIGRGGHQMHATVS